MRKLLFGRGRLTVALAAVACLVGAGAATAALTGNDPFGSSEVGQQANGSVLLPTNQWITPLGTQTLVNNGRLVSSNLSPDGNTVAALSWNDFTGFLTLINVKTNTVLQQVGSPAVGIGDGTVAADGPYYSPDGKTLWVPQTSDILEYSVNANGTVATTPTVIALPTNVPDGEALPSGMAFSSDGTRAYVALNGANTLGVLDLTQTPAKLIDQIPVGNAPRQVVLDGSTAYVSNEGGRPAQPGDFTNLSDGTPIVSSDITGGPTTGTVSVVDVSTDTQVKSIEVGLEPTALYQNGSALFVANSDSDSVSVIDTATNALTQTDHINPVPGASVGSYADAISMPDPTHVLIAIGRDNAIADYSYSGLTTKMQLIGLLPTAWYPVQVEPDPSLGAGEIVVTNDKGVGDFGPKSPIGEGPGTSPAPSTVTGHNTYDDTGSVTTFTLPADGQVPTYTREVFTDNAWNLIPQVNDGAYDTVPAVVPKRIDGGSSPIKHIVVIIRENRTYDQVLGDLGEGNGDPGLAQFGQKVTPNAHALAMRFGDLDNFYDEGTLSADGHNWIVQADAPDYIEKEFGAFYRSYPAQGGDALAYQRDGFLWNAAQDAGLSVRVYGEYANFLNEDQPWTKWYEDSLILEGKASGNLPIPTTEYKTYSDIPSLNAILDPYYPKFDLDIPDQYRVDMWLQEFKHFESLGRLPNLELIWLPDDHTGGPPYPVAQAADNDLALGRIVDTISHSKFWPSTAIFVDEDDTQNGADHIDGHRGPALVISPYSKAGVDDSYYTQLDMVRTIEQILGIPPMNQEDRAAEPMYNAFTSTANLAPYDVLPNQIPLTEGVDPAADEAAVPTGERATYESWMAWMKQQHFTGAHAMEDYAKPALLNRLDWYESHNWQVAYPNDPKIYGPNQIPAWVIAEGDDTDG